MAALILSPLLQGTLPAQPTCGWTCIPWGTNKQALWRVGLKWASCGLGRVSSSAGCA